MTIILTIHLPAQQSSQNPDWLSYDYYMKAQWDSVIIYGQKTLKQYGDYYYLRMRLGIAYVMKKNFLSAIPHFEKALAFEPDSYDAFYYLSECYRWTNRAQRIGIWFNRLSQNNQKLSTGNKPSWLNSVDFYLGAKKSNLRNNPKNQNYAVFGFSHAMTSRMQWIHQFTFLQENLQRNARYQQFQYYLSVPFFLTSDWHLIPSWHYVQFGDGGNQKSFSLWHLTMRYDFRKITFYLFGGITGKPDQEQQQAGISLFWYPAGNLNYYLGMTSAMHKDHQTNSGFSPVFTALGGLALSGRLWIEAEAAFGKRTNYFESSGSLIYNTDEPMYERFAVKPLFLVDPKFILYAKLMTEHKKDENLQMHYHHLSVLGGLTWKF